MEMFYGTTPEGGAQNNGTVPHSGQRGQFLRHHESRRRAAAWRRVQDQQSVRSSTMKNAMCAALLACVSGLALVSTAHAAKTTILHRFDGSDGTNTQRALTPGPDGGLCGPGIGARQLNAAPAFAMDTASGMSTPLHHCANNE